jgi:RimJ/RimL family protein N-acetyltransferase
MRLLEFVPATRKVLRLLASEPEDFAAQYDIHLHEVAQAVAQHSLAFMKTYPYETSPDWFGYLVVEGETRQLVGTCSLKGPPVEGTVEIAYYTFPGFEGRGIGTEMARFLVGRAGTLPDVTSVIAHTAAEGNASTRILEKIGMRFAG